MDEITRFIEYYIILIVDIILIVYKNKYKINFNLSFTYLHRYDSILELQYIIRIFHGYIQLTLNCILWIFKLVTLRFLEEGVNPFIPPTHTFPLPSPHLNIFKWPPLGFAKGGGRAPLGFFKGGILISRGGHAPP